MTMTADFAWGFLAGVVFVLGVFAIYLQGRTDAGK